MRNQRARLRNSYISSTKTSPKSANIVIYAIDTVIEKWRERHGYYPTKIYIQIDGGAENANR